MQNEMSYMKEMLNSQDAQRLRDLEVISTAIGDNRKEVRSELNDIQNVAEGTPG